MFYDLNVQTFFFLFFVISAGVSQTFWVLYVFCICDTFCIISRCFLDFLDSMFSPDVLHFFCLVLQVVLDGFLLCFLHIVFLKFLSCSSGFLFIRTLFKFSTHLRLIVLQAFSTIDMS